MGALVPISKTHAFSRPVSCPEIATAADAYAGARNRSEQLRALALMAMLRAVYRQGFDAGREIGGPA